MSSQQFAHEIPESILTSVERGYKLLLTSLKKGGTVFVCGNGGSAADAMHFAAELTGRYKKDRRPLAAIALGANPSEVTCIANDFGYEHVFDRPLAALGRQGDCLIGISTSGTSQNVVNAWARANQMKIATIGLTGSRNLGSLVEVPILCPSDVTARIQELHQRIYHYWCERLDGEDW